MCHLFTLPYCDSILSSTSLHLQYCFKFNTHLVRAIKWRSCHLLHSSFELGFQSHLSILDQVCFVDLFFTGSPILPPPPLGALSIVRIANKEEISTRGRTTKHLAFLPQQLIRTTRQPKCKKEEGDVYSVESKATGRCSARRRWLNSSQLLMP
jgi:hypothetical protein